MHLAGVFLRPVFRGQLMTAMHQLLDGHAGPQPVLVVRDMVQRMVKGADHRVRGPGVAHPPGPADVDAKAVTADQIGIEGDDLVVLHQARSTFLKPRVRSRPRGQKPRLDPLPAAPDVRRVQFRPDRILGDPARGHVGPREGFHLGNPRLAGVMGAAHRQDLVRRLHRADPFRHLLAFLDSEADRFQRPQPVDHDLVHRQPPVRPGMGAHHLIDLRRKAARRLRPPIPRRVVEERRSRAQLLHQRVEGDEEGRILVLPHHHMPIGAEQAGPERVMRVPQLHVGRVRRIADVQRIEQQEPAVVPRHQPGDQLAPAILAHPAKIRQLQPRRLPFPERGLRRPDRHPVIVIGRPVAQRSPARRVDLPAVAVIVHGPLPFAPD